VAAVLVSLAAYEGQLEDARNAIAVYEGRQSDPDLRIPWEKAEVEFGVYVSANRGALLVAMVVVVLVAAGFWLG
jgi:hypothetical protein